MAECQSVIRWFLSLVPGLIPGGRNRAPLAREVEDEKAWLKPVCCVSSPCCRVFLPPTHPLAFTQRRDPPAL